MTLTHIILILVVGTVAGFINAMAGGGSLLTMPTLIFLGLPASTANGTNRVALLIQNMTGIWNFRRKGFFDWKLSLWLSIPAVVGSLIGASFAVSIPDGLFNKILAVVMIVVVVFIIWQPQKKMAQSEKPITKGRMVAACIIFFIVGLYGGFIQAGVGFLMIAGMTAIFGMSLVKVNAIKLFVAGVYILASFLIFVFHGEVDWLLGFVLAIGNALGAWIGTHFAVSKGEKWIRIVLVIAVVLMAAKLFGLFTFILS
ncbi:MAG TPA: sulfite exporter TauE/SafE family protein [Bacillales bacterium]|nr:sulfite exporter TauE/SafE family protein [Bacillales bacterium]